MIAKVDENTGFTLLELLAVLLILAILFLIAVPIIRDIIIDSRKEALQHSASNIIKSAKFYLSLKELEWKGLKELKLDLKTENVLDYKGKRPDRGELYINEDREISILVVMYGFCAIKLIDSGEIRVVEENSEECSLNTALNIQIQNPKILAL